MNRTWVMFLLITAGFSCTPSQKPEQQEAKKPRKVIQRGEKKTEKQPLKALTMENFQEKVTTYAAKNPGKVWVLETDKGTIEIALNSYTPLHKASLIYLTDKGYFTKTFFHRVDKDFVIQAGNTDGDDTQSRRAKMGTYTLPAELHRQDLHYSGAVAMARSYTNNPEKRSSPFEFYIVTSPPVPASELDAAIEHYKLNLNPKERANYLELGGAPHLDGEHTIIGRVTKGMEVARAINAVPTDEGEWPIENIVIQRAYIKR